jgi:hypothetical protein
MTAGKIISFLGLIAMTVVLIYGFVVGNFTVDGGEILQNPWGIVSLVDLYTGFILFSGWIAYRETNIFRISVWIILMMVLGFWAGSLYAFLAFYQSKGDWKTFWMGNRA